MGTAKTFLLGERIGRPGARSIPNPHRGDTATTGLQEQILQHDIPRLAETGALEGIRVAVVKEQGRYFCPRQAAMLEEAKANAQLDMFSANKEEALGGEEQTRSILQAFHNGEGDGDRDSWESEIPACWPANCATTADTCVNRACASFDVCPFMLAHSRIVQAQLIIVNQDLVLADLKQRCQRRLNSDLYRSKLDQGRVVSFQTGGWGQGTQWLAFPGLLVFGFGHVAWIFGLSAPGRDGL